MDNAPWHRSLEMHAAVRRRNGVLLYLPTYSPDYNPIELVFCQLKKWLTLQGAQLLAAGSDPVAVIGRGLEVITIAAINGCIDHVHYIP
jgi:hypothetical protein